MYKVTLWYNDVRTVPTGIKPYVGLSHQSIDVVTFDKAFDIRQQCLEHGYNKEYTPRNVSSIITPAAILRIDIEEFEE